MFKPDYQNSMEYRIIEHSSDLYYKYISSIFNQMIIKGGLYAKSIHNCTRIQRR